MSMGGHMASIVGVESPEVVGIVPCLSFYKERSQSVGRLKISQLFLSFKVYFYFYLFFVIIFDILLAINSSLFLEENDYQNKLINFIYLKKKFLLFLLCPFKFFGHRKRPIKNI